MRKAPQLVASSFYLKKPERIRALWMVRTGGLLVDAALESRMRTVLQAHDAMCPNQNGPPVQHPTARWVFQYFVGMHGLRISGQWDPLVVHRTEAHQSLLRLLGKSSGPLYRCIFTKMRGAVRNVG